MLKRISNISVGGTPEDVTARVHPDNRTAVERAARVLDLDIAGVDFLCPDISRSWREVGGGICEVNSQPELGLHCLSCPDRDIDQEIFAALHEGHEFRIPVVALFPGATSPAAARLLQQVWRQEGRRVGVALGRGLWLDDEAISSKAKAGEDGGALLLRLPETEAAIMELSAEGLHEQGHPCDRYDVISLLALRPGNDPQRARHEGYGHAGNPRLALVAEMLERAGRAVLVDVSDREVLDLCSARPNLRVLCLSPFAEHPALQMRLLAQGEAMYPQQHDGGLWLMHARGPERRRLLRLGDAPQGPGVQPAVMVALQAAALATVLGLSLQSISGVLQSVPPGAPAG